MPCSSFSHAVTIIGIAGGSVSGKTTLAKKLAEQFAGKVAVISQDDYYKDVSQLSEDERKKCNFDEPDTIDFTLLKSHLLALKKGENIPRLEFSYTSFKSIERGVIKSAPVVIVEGILLFAVEAIRSVCDFKIFVELDGDTRLARRLDYYQKAYGYSLESLIPYYFSKVKPAHEKFIAPSKQYADIVVLSHKDTTAAEAMLKAFIQNSIEGASFTSKPD